MKNNNASSQQSILVVGDVYAETQYFVESIPTEEEFTIASDATSVFGSKTINASRILSRLGNKVNFFAHVGNDKDGENSIRALQGWGINSLVAIIEKKKTGKIVVVTNKSGKSAITLYRGANQTISPQIISSLEDEISNHDAVYSATNLQLDSLYLLTELCNKHGVPLFIDVPNQQSELNLSKISSADFFAPNRQEAQLLTKQTITTVENAKKASLILREKLKGTIIITLDKDGCVLLKSGNTQPQHVAATSAESADETAAGDIFRAVFLYSFLKSKSIDQAVVKALSIATESTKIKGVDETLSNVNLS